MFGFGSFFEYAERLFGFSPRWTVERLRVAEALEGLPKMAGALAKGELSWSATRELTRVAVADTEGDWLEQGRGRTGAISSGWCRGSSAGTDRGRLRGKVHDGTWFATKWAR